MKASRKLTLDNSRSPRLIGPLSSPLYSDLRDKCAVLYLSNGQQCWLHVGKPLECHANDWLHLRFKSRELLVPADAEILIVNARGELKLIAAGVLRPGDRVYRCPIPPCSSSMVHDIGLDGDIAELTRKCRRQLKSRVSLTGSLGWWHGASVGNMSITRDGARARGVRFCDPRPEMRGLWCRGLNQLYDGPPSRAVIDCGRGTSAHSRVYDRALATQMERDFGPISLVRRLSYLLDTPLEYRLGLAGGMLGTDGYLPLLRGSSAGYIDYITASPELAVQSFNLMESLGYDPIVSEYTNTSDLPGRARKLAGSKFYIRICSSDFVTKPRLQLGRDEKEDRQAKLFRNIRPRPESPPFHWNGLCLRGVDPVGRPSGYRWPLVMTPLPLRTISGFFVRVRPDRKAKSPHRPRDV